MNKYYVYFHINPVKREIFYVGKGTGDRAYVTLHRSNFYDKVVNKYGPPIIVIVRDNISDKYAILLEIAYIKIIGRRNKKSGTLVNLTDGGDGTSGYKHTEETKLKLSEKSMGNTRWLGRTHSEETKQKISKAAKGYKHTDEAKKKISDANMGNQNLLGHKHTDESKLKMSKAGKGRKHTEEAKQKIAAAHKLNRLGEDNPCYGKKWITNLELRLNKYISVDELEECFKEGWILGRTFDFNKNADEIRLKLSKAGKGKKYKVAKK